MWNVFWVSSLINIFLKGEVEMVNVMYEVKIDEFFFGTLFIKKKNATYHDILTDIKEIVDNYNRNIIGEIGCYPRELLALRTLEKNDIVGHKRFVVPNRSEKTAECIQCFSDRVYLRTSQAEWLGKVVLSVEECEKLSKQVRYKVTIDFSKNRITFENFFKKITLKNYVKKKNTFRKKLDVDKIPVLENFYEIAFNELSDTMNFFRFPPDYWKDSEDGEYVFCIKG